MNRVPLWLKLAFTLFIVAWVPVVVRVYSAKNFLWVCDVSNFILLIALWTENRLLASSQLVAVVLVDLLWSVDVIGRLLFGVHVVGGTEYMFNEALPLYGRLFSLFHMFVPFILVFLARRLGYDGRGVVLQIAITCVLLPLTYWLTEPERNVNWLYEPFGVPQTLMPTYLWMFVLMLLCPLLLYLPTHAAVVWLRKRVRSPD